MSALTERLPGAKASHQTPSATTTPRGTFSVTLEEEGHLAQIVPGDHPLPSSSPLAAASAGFILSRIPPCFFRRSSCS